MEKVSYCHVCVRLPPPPPPSSIFKVNKTTHLHRTHDFTLHALYIGGIDVL